MNKYILALLLAGITFQTRAQFSAADLDSAARNSNKTSIMYQRMTDEEYERLERERQEAYERERMEEERRLEQERQNALKPVDLFGKSIKIYAEINGDVLTTQDMQERVNIFVATTQIPVTKQNKKMVLERVLQSAVDEKIKIQEAEKNGINITPADLQTGLQNFASGNSMSVAELKEMLKSMQVNETVFTQQLKAEMAWARLIQQKIVPTVNVSGIEVKNAIEAANKNAGVEKFMVQELVISKKKAEGLSDLVQTLRQDPRFELYAIQFSESPTAQNGGNLGWVTHAQVADKIGQTLKKLKVGDVSDPILVGNDYYIIKLAQKYTPGVDKMPVPNEAETKMMLFNKKTEESAARYLKTLRNRAIVERKM